MRLLLDANLSPEVSRLLKKTEHDTAKVLLDDACIAVAGLMEAQASPVRFLPGSM